jgi:hypothetical protein
VSDGIGKIILALQVVIGLISALALMVAFVLHSLRASFGRTHA